MSEGDKSHTAVLLPSARVVLFTRDGDTKGVFHALQNDWRFARVRLEAVEGDVETAISHYANVTPPELLIIQTEHIDGSFTEKLDVLAGRLSENTSAIVIGPVNDINLYRHLIGMGVSDYLVKPVKQDALGNDIAATLLQSIGTAGSHLVAVMGAKGGVGATVLSEALSWHVADAFGQKTFLLDAAGGWSTLSVGMNFEPSTTLAEAVRAAMERNEDSLTRMIHSAGERLSVLSSGGDVMLDDNVEPGRYEALLDYLMGLYPVVISDLSASTAAIRRTVLTRAHMILLVTTPLLPSVRAARTLLQEIKELRGGDTGAVQIVLNMQGYAPKAEVPRGQIQEGLERPLSAVIPFDPETFVNAESEGARLSSLKNGDEIVKNLARPVKELLSVSQAEETDTGEKKGGIGQLLTKLKTKS